MPTATDVDLEQQAYDLGYQGKPLSEKLKRAAETNHAVFEAWRAGRYDAGVDAEGKPKTGPNNPSTSSSTTRGAGRPKSKVKKRPAKKTPLSRRHGAGGRAYRAARNDALRTVTPVGTQVGHLILLGLGLVVLYLMLTSVGALKGVVGLVQNAVTWVVSDTATV